MNWVRSSYCHTSSCCVEVARTGGEVWVRDSKDPDGPVLRFTRDEWSVFQRDVKAGGFDTH